MSEELTQEARSKIDNIILNHKYTDATDVSQLKINSEQILSGEIFTKQQLMDCIIDQTDKINSLFGMLEKASKYVIQENIKGQLKDFIRIMK